MVRRGCRVGSKGVVPIGENCFIIAFLDLFRNKGVEFVRLFGTVGVILVRLHQVMDDVSASCDDNAFLPQGGQFFSKGVLIMRGKGPIDTEGNNRK